MLSGAISPGSAIVGYRIDGFAGERLKFHSDAFSSTAGIWSLYGPDNHYVNQTNFGSDFQADLTTDGYYDLFLSGNNNNPASPITYQIEVSDISDAQVNPSGLNTIHSGTLPAGGSASFDFTASAGQRIEFDSQVANPVTYTITDPNTNQVFATSYNNDGMTTLTASGTYKVTATGASGLDYAFNVVPLPTAATPLNLGTYTSGSVAAYSDVAYSFLGTPGQRLSYLYNLGAPYPANVQAHLYAPDGTQVFDVYNDSSGYSPPTTITQPGRYYLVVDSEQPTAANYEFILSDANATPISTNATITDSFPNGRGLNTYTFSGTAGERLYIQPQSSSPANSTAYSVFRPDNSTIINYATVYSGDDVAVTLDQTGTYILSVAGNDATNATAADTINIYQSSTPSNPLTLGATVSGNLPRPGAEHQYTFTGAPGQTLFFDGLASDPNLDFSITDPNGSYYYSGQTSADYGQIQLSLPGIYTVTVYGSGASTGNYGFNIDDISTAANLTTNTTTSGTLATGLSTNLYSFTATAGQRLAVQGLADSHVNGAYYYVYGPDNHLYLQGYTDPSNYTYYPYPLPYSGTYTLAVTGQAAANPSDDFSLKVDLSTTPPADAITLNSVVSGNIPTPNSQHVYTFMGTAGHSLFFDGQGPTGTNILEYLTDPSGTAISSGGNIGYDYGPYLLTKTGTYTLTIVGPYSADTGPYSFALDDFAKAQTLAIGSPTSGTLASGLADDLYQFTGTAGHQFDIQGISDAQGGGAYYTLYGPNDENLGGTYTLPGYNFSRTLPESGTYTLVVAGQSPANPTDAYSFEAFDSVQVSPVPDPLTLNATTTGMISTPGAQHVYSFSGTAGQTLDLNGLTSTPGLLVAIDDPTGNAFYLGGNTINNGQYFPIVLPKTGQYTLIVNSGGQGTTGSYAFALRDFASATTINPGAAAGATVSGTLATGITTDLYSFTGSTGDRLSFQGLNDQNQNGAYYYLYGPDHAYETQGPTALSDYNAITLPKSGTYTLLVVGQNPANPSDAYSLNLTETKIATDPLTLNAPLAAPGTIAVPGAEHNYTFTGAAGQTLLFDGLSGANNIIAYLYDPFGSNVDIGGNNVASDVGPFTLTRAGTYTLTVLGNNATGNYNFEILDASTHPITLPANNVTGTLNPGTQAAIYEFAGTAGQAVTFHATMFTSTAGTWYLYGPDNNYISSATLGSDFSATLPENGTFHLVLFGNDVPSNSYSFNVTVVKPNVVTPTNFNKVQTGSLAAGASTVPGTYTFNAPAGTVVYFDNQGSTDFTFSLTDPVTNAVFNTNNDTGFYFLTRSGTYNLRVTNNSGATEAYAFSLDALPSGAAALTLGATVSGSLAASAVSFYQFSGTAGQAVYFDSQLASTTANAYLYSPTFGTTVFGTNASNDAGPYFLPSTGTYTLLLTNYDTAATNFQFRVVDPAANPLTTNAVTTGTLNPGSATDVYSFSGTAGQQVAIQPISESASYGAYYNLVSPSGSVIAQGYLETNYSPTLTLPYTGSYTFVVAGLQGSTTDAYQIEIYQSTPAATLSLTLGTAVSGMIATPGGQQTYSFTGTAGHLLYFDGRGPINNNFVEVITDPNGTVISNSGSAYSDYGPYVLTTTGTYTLTILSNAAGSGAYNFDLFDFNTAPPLTLNVTTNGTLASGLADDVYSFNGTAGHQLLIQGLGDANAYEAYYQLFGPNGQYFTGYYTDLNYNNLVTLTQTGAYTLVIEGQNDANTGNTYSLAVFDNAPQATKTLTLDAITTGTIARPGAQDVYTFTGSAGQALDFNGLTSAPGLQVVLTSPSGNAFYLGGNTVNNGQYFPIVLPESGTYTITISGSNTPSTGSYAFALRDVAKAKALTTNVPAGGTLASGITTDLYSFTASAGQVLALQGLMDANPYGAYIYIYRPDFQYVMATYADANYYTQSQVLTETGTYYLLVVGQSDANSNDAYQFEVSQSTVKTSALTLGAPVTDTLSVSGAQNSYTFTGTPGERLIFDGLGNGSNSLANSNIYVTLTDPFGNNIGLPANGGSLNDSSYPIYLTEGGTYTLTVAAYNYTGASGGYSFNLINAAAAKTLTPNSPTSGTLASGLADDTYSFLGTAGQQVYIQGLADGHANSAYYELFGADSTSPILSGYTDSATSNAFNTLPMTGRYTLIVYGTTVANTTDSYSLEVWLSTIQTQALTFNAPISGTIHRPGDYQTYTFTGVPGQRLVFDGQNTPSGTIYATLYGPGNGGTAPGNYIGQYNLASDGVFTPALSEAGTYTLVISASDNSTGSYSFQMIDGATLTKVTVGAVEADVQVTLSAASATDVTIHYTTQDHTATSPEDYHAVQGILTIPAGQISATIPIQIVNDADSPVETIEDFYVILSNPSPNATIQRGQATVAIQEGPLVTITDVTGTAPLTGTTTFTFIASLSSPSPNPVTVQYVTMDGSAKSPGDYLGVSTPMTITFPAGVTSESITITVNGSNAGGPDKTFSVVLSSPTYSLLGTKSTGTGTIHYPSPTGSVTGDVFNDLNDNGVHDGGEGGFSGWTIDLLNGSTVVTSAVTDSNGNFTISGVAPGTYTLAEVLQSGYTQTAPGSPGTFSVTVSAGNTSSGYEFGDILPVLTGISITPLNPSVAKGLSEQFDAMGSYTDHINRDITYQVSWTSSNTAVATINSSGTASTLATGTTTIAAAFGGFNASTVLTVSAAVLVSIDVTPVNPTVAKGLNEQFAALGTYTDGSTQILTTQVTWSSSNTAVATISNASGSQGLAAAVFQGTTYVSATLGGVSNYTLLTVTPPALVSIAVTPANPTVAKGLNEQFFATATYTDKSTTDITNQVTWASANTAVATISNAPGSPGLAAALTQGTASISATFSGFTGSTVLTVSQAALVSIAIAPANPSVAKGLTQQFIATGTYTDSTMLVITNQVTWTSSNTTTATISNAAGSQGLATALFQGTTSISATLGGVFNSTTLTVTPPALTSIAVTPSNPSVAKGLFQQFTAMAIYTDNSTSIITTQVTWASSNTGVATISNTSGSQGLSFAVTQGTSTITATFGGIAGMTTITVVAPSLQSITVTPSNPSISKGSKLQFMATGTYSDNTTQNLTNQVAWVSANMTVATISNTSGSQGLASALATGTSGITATLGAISGTTTLTVSAATLQSISVTPANPSVAKGLTFQFMATGTYSDNTTQILTNQVTWASANTGVATISNAAGSQGLASALAQGNTSITATLGGVAGSTTLTVNPAALVSIAVTPANPSVAKGLTEQFMALATYTDNSTSVITTQATWASSNTTTATISNTSGSQGLASTLATGTTTITATLGGVVGSTTLTVTPAVLTSLAVIPAIATTPKGTTYQFTASGTYTDGSTQILTAQATWASSNTTTATISNAAGSQGLASALAQGSTTITASFGSFTGSASLNVTNAALVSIAVMPSNPSIAKGLTQQFMATGTYSDNTTQILTNQVTWASATSSVATITSSGLATGVGVGTSTITAALGGITGSTALNVTSAQLVSIAVTPTNPSIAKGATRQFAATGTYTDNTTQILTSSVTWASATTSVATITSTGLATGVGVGTSTITATSGGVTGSTTLAVALPVLVPAAVKDNGQAGYYEYGTWTDGSGGLNGSDRVTGPGTTSTSVRWVLTVPAGTYTVYASWMASSGNTAHAPYTFVDGFTELGTASGNQQVAPADGQYQGVAFASLGNYTFTKGTALVAMTASGDGNTVADAILLVPVSGPLVRSSPAFGGSGMSPAATGGSGLIPLAGPGIVVATSAPNVSTTQRAVASSGIRYAPRSLASYDAALAAIRNPSRVSQDDLIGQLARERIAGRRS